MINFRYPLGHAVIVCIFRLKRELKKRLGRPSQRDRPTPPRGHDHSAIRPRAGLPSLDQLQANVTSLRDGNVGARKKFEQNHCRDRAIGQLSWVSSSAKTPQRYQGLSKAAKVVGFRDGDCHKLSSPFELIHQFRTEHSFKRRKWFEQTPFDESNSLPKVPTTLPGRFPGLFH